MPSRVVDDLWHAFMLHTREYADFCTAAFGRFLHHSPEAGMDTAGVRRNESSGLARTLELAHRDEAALPGQLPLLFRLDEQLGIADGRRYLGFCGSAAAACFAPAGSTCLAHLPRPRMDGDSGGVHGGHGDSGGDGGGGNGGGGDGGGGGGCGSS